MSGLDVQGLTDEERVALPAVHHAPVFDALRLPPYAWICAVCWGEGWTTGWPCDPAVAGGRELGHALGLRVAE